MSLPVSRPVHRHHGGKWRLAPKILEHMPEHRVYVEACGGAGSLLLRKDPSPVEVYNDADRNLVDLFAVLRDPEMAERLRHAVGFTPYSVVEYEYAEERVRFGFAQHSSDSPADRIERARCVLVYASMGYAGYAPGRSWQFRRDIGGTGSTMADAWAAKGESLLAVTERLKRVTLECDNALAVCQRYDAPDALHYFDPPYVKEARTASQGYAFEMTEAQHLDLLLGIHELQGTVLLSGYASKLYGRALSSATRHALGDVTTIGARHGEQSRRTEWLWVLPAGVKSRSPYLEDVLNKRAREAERQQLPLLAPLLL